MQQAIMLTILSMVLAFELVLFSLPALNQIAKKKNFYHETAVSSKQDQPLTLGGLAIFVGFSISSVICTYPYGFNDFVAIVAAQTILFFFGVVYETIGLSKIRQTIVCIAACAIVVYVGDVHVDLSLWHIPMWQTDLMCISLILIGMISFSFIVSRPVLMYWFMFLMSLGFSIFFIAIKNYKWAVVSSALLGSILGGLHYNYVIGPKNIIRLGKTGVYIVSILFGIFLVHLLQSLLVLAM
ncbi:MAG: hypothetical protein Q8859_00680 [Bacteroidota bacterium]|nr:hypothetical protein [Bacteroidota bacterium]